MVLDIQVLTGIVAQTNLEGAMANQTINIFRLARYQTSNSKDLSDV